jgi:aspartyl-tRNA(Asn)/glutamyl-tRNA(Gln) amidotransferase subunit A
VLQPDVKEPADLSDAPLTSVVVAAAALSRREASSRELVSTALARGRDPAGEGTRVFTQRYEATALGEAEAWDARHAAGAPVTALGGLPVSVKDLFDVAGQVTTAGSRVLADAPAAKVDAEIVTRLRDAGAIIVGKTNMTEFAYSGVGLNPHYGTPRNPFDRARARIPGGSSSGAAVSVADGMCMAAIGSDTGGSVRVPAALCGLVGFKPTADRISRRGVYPLSRTLDSIGPIARTVECCAVLDAVMAGLSGDVPAPVPGTGLRLLIARTLVWDDADPHVAASIEAALSRLSRAGVELRDVPLAELAEIPQVNARGGIAAAEAFAWHRTLLDRAKSAYDPRVAIRIEQGRSMSAADYLDLLDARARIGRSVLDSIGEDAIWAMPTVPHTAPEIAALEKDEPYFATNRLMLRNAALVNFLDGCAITLPCHAAGSAPVGLSLVAANNQDRRLLAVARAAAPLIAAP